MGERLGVSAIDGDARVERAAYALFCNFIKVSPDDPRASGRWERMPERAREERRAEVRVVLSALGIKH